MPRPRKTAGLKQLGPKRTAVPFYNRGYADPKKIYTTQEEYFAGRRAKGFEPLTDLQRRIIQVQNLRPRNHPKPSMPVLKEPTSEEDKKWTIRKSQSVVSARNKRRERAKGSD
jgi:hypothetical protein